MSVLVSPASCVSTVHAGGISLNGCSSRAGGFRNHLVQTEYPALFLAAVLCMHRSWKGRCAWRWGRPRLKMEGQAEQQSSDRMIVRVWLVVWGLSWFGHGFIEQGLHGRHMAGCMIHNGMVHGFALGLYEAAGTLDGLPSQTHVYSPARAWTYDACC